MSQDEKLRSLERELQRSGVDCIVLPRSMHKDLVEFYAIKVKGYAYNFTYNSVNCKVSQGLLNKLNFFYQRMLAVRCYEVEEPEWLKKLVSEVTTDYERITMKNRQAVDEENRKLITTPCSCAVCK